MLATVQAPLAIAVELNTITDLCQVLEEYTDLLSNIGDSILLWAIRLTLL